MAKVPAREKSAAPGTEDKKAKKEKVTKVDYPGLKNAEGESVLLTEVPADHDSKLHKPLKKANFENEATYLRMKADEFEAKAVALRKEADVSEKMGSKSERAKAKKLVQMQERMAELKKQLEASGVDVEALMG